MLTNENLFKLLEVGAQCLGNGDELHERLPEKRCKHYVNTVPAGDTEDHANYVGEESHPIHAYLPRGNKQKKRGAHGVAMFLVPEAGTSELTPLLL